MREDVPGMIQEAIAEAHIIETATIVGNGTWKGIHMVDMTMNTVERETDMKVPGEHQVCNNYALFFIFILFFFL